MPENAATETKSSSTIDVPLPKVVGFVRQLNHDLRNHLNAAELQSAYLHEIANDDEVKLELQRLRGMLSEMGSSLQRLSASLAQPKLTVMPYEAGAFVEDLRAKLVTQFPQQHAGIEWNVSAGDAVMEVDPQLLQQAVIELIANAFQHGRDSQPITARARVQDGQFILTFSEPKTEFSRSTENWGREPFGGQSHGHYGLGLHRALSIIEAHGGNLDARYDSATCVLVTTVGLPLARG